MITFGKRQTDKKPSYETVITSYFKRFWSACYISKNFKTLTLITLEESRWNKLQFEKDLVLVLWLIDHVTHTHTTETNTLAKKETVIDARLSFVGPSKKTTTKREKDCSRAMLVRHITDIRSPENYILQLNDFTQWQRSDLVWSSVPLLLISYLCLVSLWAPNVVVLPTCCHSRFSLGSKLGP